MTEMKKVPFGGWQNCISLTGGGLELVVTLDVGPRVIHCAPVGQKNLFYVNEADLGQTGGNVFRLFGGHRLWHAPEMQPRTYVPDNTAVAHEWDGATLTLSAPVETLTGIQKSIRITLDSAKPTVSLEHILTNTGVWDVTAAPWALTNMAPGGCVILPQEPFIPFPDCLLPARPLVLWTYTNMADPRFRWESDHVVLRQDPAVSVPQKIGIRNSRGWGAYLNNGTVFVKQAALEESASYPDFGCNFETYVNADFAELETLGPLAAISANGGEARHHETWHVLPAASGDPGEVFRDIAPRMDSGRSR